MMNGQHLCGEAGNRTGMMQRRNVRVSKRVWAYFFLSSGAALVLMVLLASGCASSRHSHFRSDPVEESFTLPPFLAGPVAVLLTNANDFSGRMVVELPAVSGTSKTITGSLLAQGTRLMFAPAIGDRTFIWDETQSSGYILSEALQGFAAIASSVQITNVAAPAGAAASVLEMVNGRPCRRTEAMVSGNDGLTTRFIIWREVGANGFPVRIKSVDGMTRLIINFSDCRRQSFAQKLFLPPEGFTRYATVQTLRDELETRQEAAGKRLKREDDEGVSGIGHLNASPQHNY